MLSGHHITKQAGKRCTVLHAVHPRGRIPARRHVLSRAAATHQETSSSPDVKLPPVVNWHLEERCNYACKFCFATFPEIKREEVLKKQHLLLAVPGQLRQAGAEKLTFVGGEPFLHPLINELIQAAKEAGLTTCVVTNGSLLTTGQLTALRPYLDWMSFSIDASNDDIHTRMGRGVRPVLARGKSSSHLEEALPLWHHARSLGYRMKLNTVVCSENLHDDMVDLVGELQPERWKVFQVLPMGGQNDGVVDPLLISNEQFQSWVDRHRRVEEAGVKLVPEDNSAMTGTYAMLDARCKFYTNSQGHYEYGPSIHDVGVPEAWQWVGGHFDDDKFVGRGGVYDWTGPGGKA